MICVVLGYNNAIHTTTGYTPFQVVKRHIQSDHPFNLLDHKTVTNYIQNHKETKSKTELNKEKLITNLNENRDDPVQYKLDNNACIKT